MPVWRRRRYFSGAAGGGIPPSSRLCCERMSHERKRLPSYDTWNVSQHSPSAIQLWFFLWGKVKCFALRVYPSHSRVNKFYYCVFPLSTDVSTRFFFYTEKETCDDDCLALGPEMSSENITGTKRDDLECHMFPVRSSLMCCPSLRWRQFQRICYVQDFVPFIPSLSLFFLTDFLLSANRFIFP